jgi:5-methyltetrahydropteroyltriglutamate--homocysteine methyltransferase
MNQIISSNLGYPRIGEQREWKVALEQYWSGKIGQDELKNELKQIRLGHLQRQLEEGVDLIPVGDFSLYDHMLDTATMFGMVPKRYSYEGGPVPLDTYFSMARGNQTAVASEMTKWFNTNYHYIVPEYSDEVKLTLTENKPLKAYREAKEELGIEGKPVLIGPYTFIKFSKGYTQKQLPAFILQLVPLYIQILKELVAEGVQWVQIDEPILTTSLTADEMKTIQSIYQQLQDSVPQINILLQTYFDSIEYYSDVIQLPVQGIGLDFVHGFKKNLANLREVGFPADKVLGVGVIDGRNIWRADLSVKYDLVKSMTEMVDKNRLWIQPSCSLLHVPVAKKQETGLKVEIQNALSFADEKLAEIRLLVQAFRDGRESVQAAFDESRTALQQLAALPERNGRTVDIQETHFHRNATFEQRQHKQQALLRLPLLPTTTIGSFPQTAEVRQARRKWRNGEWSTDHYDRFIQEQMKKWINIQEEIGLDVLVHGEFERTDMVEFFGEKLGGFVFTQNGWVQSYGSRCVKPPIIYGNVEFIEPMTVKESQYAQSLTTKPVKGMITGPVTILQWSFVRDDLSRQEVAYQIASALRQEVKALEAAGIKMIQVDEPALGEGLPLKREEWDQYLDWAVKAFRLTTSVVRDETQIHTHMCYCEFHEFIDAIRDLDADVISIETSRSHGELVDAFKGYAYQKGIGLGVYDIHSPRIPSVEEITQIIERGLQVLEPRLFWINPDCGLKTRGIEETIASLKNMVKATQQVRKRVLAKA